METSGIFPFLAYLVHSKLNSEKCQSSLELSNDFASIAFLILIHSLN